MTEEKKTCAECRFVGTYKRPKIMDSTGFDDQLMFEDKDETVYMCKAPGEKTSHAGMTIGIVPITCSAFELGAKPSRLDELDRMIAAREKRTGERP